MFPFYFLVVDSTRLIEARELEDMAISQSKRPRKDGQFLDSRDRVQVYLKDGVVVRAYRF